MFPRLPFPRAVALIGAILFGGSGICAAAQITSPPFLTTLLGSPTYYQITADNGPTSFDATNLPPGMSLDRTTGLISGVPSLSGDYYTDVVAHAPGGDASGSVNFIVYLPTPAPDPYLGGPNIDCRSLIADPNRPRVYCGAGTQELIVIDTDTMSIVTRIPDTGIIVSMTISGDGGTLWFINTYYYESLARVDLNTLNGYTTLPTSRPVSTLCEGLDNRLYAATRSSLVFQLDATTGALQQQFQPEGSPLSAAIAISPDRRTLYLGHTYYVAGPAITQAALSRYDIATATPGLLQRVEMQAPSIPTLAVAPDGNSIFALQGTFDGYPNANTHQILCLAAQDLTITGALSYRGSAYGSITLSADGTRALVPAGLGDLGELTTPLVYIFDPRSSQLLKTVVLGTGVGIVGGDAVFNRSGSSLITTITLNPRLRAYSTALPPPPVTPPKSLLNISTRLLTQNGDNVLIGGFIVTGSGAKQVILRAIGPSLPVQGQLSDPVLELHGPGGAIIAENDNWNSHRSEVIATGIPPSEEREAAIVTTLQPGAYTVILRGFSGSTGIAAVEAYDLNASADSRLANISTRGKVETGDNVMIGGWIIGGSEVTKVAVRALGPSLAGSGITSALADPTLNVHNGNGALIAQNDDWRSAQEQALIAAGLAPASDRESAILLSLTPGNYTAIVRGTQETSGIALVEVYNLQ